MPEPTDAYYVKSEDSTAAWFVVLERARDAGDFPRAAEAQEALRRLGVEVSVRELRGSRRRSAHPAAQDREGHPRRGTFTVMAGTAPPPAVVSAAGLSMPQRPSRRAGRRAKPPAPSAPVGPNVPVRFGQHAEERFVQRLSPRGVTRQQVIDAIRKPNTKRKDEWDPDFPGERVRRYVRLAANGGGFLTVRVVLIVVRDPDARDAIEVITLVPEHHR